MIQFELLLLFNFDAVTTLVNTAPNTRQRRNLWYWKINQIEKTFENIIQENLNFIPSNYLKHFTPWSLMLLAAVFLWFAVDVQKNCAQQLKLQALYTPQFVWIFNKRWWILEKIIMNQKENRKEKFTFSHSLKTVFLLTRVNLPQCRLKKKFLKVFTLHRTRNLMFIIWFYINSMVSQKISYAQVTPSQSSRWIEYNNLLRKQWYNGSYLSILAFPNKMIKCWNSILYLYKL